MDYRVDIESDLPRTTRDIENGWAMYWASCTCAWRSAIFEGPQARFTARKRAFYHARFHNKMHDQPLEEVYYEPLQAAR